MKILHTSDWHVGRTIRGRSRAGEHLEVLAEITGIAAQEEVDLVLVVGDLFDTAAPTPEAERIVYRALLDLAGTGTTVVALAGNHDNPRRLAALEPVLELGRIVTRSGFRRPDDGGVVEVTSRDGSERAQVAVLPFLSQRHVIGASELMGSDAPDHGGAYSARVTDLLAKLCAGFGPDTVNVVAAHLTTTGGLLGGGEREAHTVFQYQVSGDAFPINAHYVALGHLHRRQKLPLPGQTHYCGSPLQLDFGETSDIKAVTVVEAHPGTPARVTDVALAGGRRLRKLTGTLATLRELAVAETGDDYLHITVREPLRVGLSDEVRDLFPNCVDVVVEPEATDSALGERPSRSGRTPTELFAEYLAEQGVDDVAVTELFGELLEEVG